MSAQGGTLARRGAVHLPIWPVAALLGAAVTVVIGMSILSGTEGRVVTSVTDAQRLANSSAAVREQGATLPLEMAQNPGMWTLSQAESYLAGLAAIENSTAAIREQGAGLAVGDGLAFHEVGRAHEVVIGGQATGITYATGLENPGASVTSVTGAAPTGPASVPEYRTCDRCHQRI
jgi:hypothetical protein